MADLSLLVDYVDELQAGLHDADRSIRAGHLGAAVWSYLSVLELDPDNPVARTQVGQVATAVRQFDRTAPGRRWIGQIRGESPAGGSLLGAWWAQLLVIIILVIVAFFIGFVAGISAPNLSDTGDKEPPTKPPPQLEDKGLMGPA
ncbi:MAG: hypothetical protein ACFCD0_02190 [Gemmataceae bacterium]